MKEFPIYRMISGGKDKHGNFNEKMEIAVLVTHTIGGRAVLGQVNRHVHYDGGQLIGRHPDYYDGVNKKNGNAEEMFASLDAELACLTQKLEELDEEIAQWVEQSKFDEMIQKIAEDCGKNSYLKLGFRFLKRFLEPLRPFAIQKLKDKRASVRAEAINVGVKKEHAQRYLAEVQRDFPRLVAYVHQHQK